MGANSAMVQVCSRLFILLALGQAAVIQTERGPLEEDEVCPCVVREDCPRIFGSEPQDALLGSFSACRNPAAVRCCGVATQISVEQSSSGLENGPVIPPVPFQFPEYVDPRTTPAPPTYESYAGEYENDETEEEFEEPTLQAAVEKSAAVAAGTWRGENIDGVVSQTSDRLDYRGVNDAGVASAIAQSAQSSSKISSSKTVESSSSSSSSLSSSDKKTIVASGVQAAVLPQISKEEDEYEYEEEEGLGEEAKEINQQEVEKRPKSQLSRGRVRYTPSLNDPLQSNIGGDSIRGDVRYSDSQFGQRGSTVVNNREETSSQRTSHKVNKESSNFQENRSSNDVAVADPESEDHLNRQASIGDAVYGDRTQVSTQQTSQSASKEAKSVEESSSSNVGSVSLTTGQQSVGTFGERRRRPVYVQQDGITSSSSSTASEQKSESVKKESSSFEEKSTSSVASVDQESGGQVIEANRNPILEYIRPIDRGTRLSSRGQAAYGQRQESSSQKSESVKQEASSFEESESSSVQSVDSNAEALVGTSPVTESRRPLYSGQRIGSKGQTVYGQRQESASQQKSESVKKASSSSNLQSVASNTEAVSDQAILETSATPVPELRRPLLYTRPRIHSRGQAVYGQRQESSSQQKTESVKQESSSFEESKSSTVESVASNTEALLERESKPEIIEATVSPVPKYRRPADRRVRLGSSNEKVYGQQQLASSLQQKTESTQTESSSFEENKSSSVQGVTSGSVASLDYGSRNKQVIGEQQSSSSQQKTESSNKESSSFEESKSSNVQSATLNNAALLDLDSRNTQVIGEQQSSSSQQKTESSNKESSSFEESKSSIVQSAILNNAALLDLDSRNTQVIGQQQSSSSQQTTESSSFEESKPSIVQSATLNNVALLDLDSRNTQVIEQQQSSSSQQKTESNKIESSSSEENKSSSVQSSNSAVLLDQGSSSGLLETSVGSVSGTGSTGQAVYAQRELESSSQQKSEILRKESSSLEENKSSIAQAAAVNSDVTSINAGVHKEEDSSSQHISESSSSKSSSVQESTASNIASVSSGARELSDLHSSLVNEVNSEHREASSSTQSENSESSSVMETTTNVASVGQVQNQASATELGIVSTGSSVSQHASSQKKSEAASSHSSSSSSNLMNLISGQTSSKVHTALADSKKSNNRHQAAVTRAKTNPWHVAYLPILINAGFLKDRPTSTGPVGLDPFAGVSLSDLMNPEVASELLPLSCGNVIFGERFMAGKTVLCNIPKDNEPPIQFFGGGEGALSRGKLDGQVYSDNFRSTGAQGFEINPASTVSMASTDTRNRKSESSSHTSSAESRSEQASKTAAVLSETENVRRPESALSLNSSNKKSESSVEPRSQTSSSETRNEEASKTAAVLSETENLSHPESTVSGIVLSQNSNIQKMESSVNTSSQSSSSESHSEESSKSASTVDAGTTFPRRPLRTRFVVKRPVVRVVPEEDTRAEVVILPAPPAQVRYSTLGEQLGSRQTATDSTSTSYSSSQHAIFAQESRTSGSETEITKSEFDVSSDKDYAAERNTEGKKANIYVLPVTPVLSLAEPIKTVEVVERNPKTRTRVSKKRSRNLSSGKKLPPNELQVVNLKRTEDGVVQEESFILPEDEAGRPSFAYQRRGRNVAVSNLAGNDEIITPDYIASTGRVNVIGPLPSGYKDPAVFDEEELIIDLGLPSGNEGGSFRHRLETRSADSFRPSPKDPINWL